MQQKRTHEGGFHGTTFLFLSRPVALIVLLWLKHLRDSSLDCGVRCQYFSYRAVNALASTDLESVHCLCLNPGLIESVLATTYGFGAGGHPKQSDMNPMTKGIECGSKTSRSMSIERRGLRRQRIRLELPRSRRHIALAMSPLQPSQSIITPRAIPRLVIDHIHKHNYYVVRRCCHWSCEFSRRPIHIRPRPTIADPIPATPEPRYRNSYL